MHEVGSIGVLGAGQLGRMMAPPASRLGLRIGFLDPSADACGGQFGPLTVADWDDAEAVRDWAGGFDVVTYEFENVPATTLAAAAAVTQVAPGPHVLAISADRLEEKRTFEAIGIDVPPYVPVAEPNDLPAAIERVGTPAMLKSRRGGYDGKGQVVVREAGDAEPGLREIGRPCLYEARVSFDAEMSIAVVRDRSGRVVAYPAARNDHAGTILAVTRAGAAAVHPSIDAGAIERATEGVRALADHLDYVGVLTVEFFVVGGRLLANEMAARVHNSMHWTLDGAVTDQFTNHVRAVAGLAAGPTDAPRPAGMVNLIGAVPSAADVPADGRHHLHRYGKVPAPGRKVGHVNLVADTAGELDALIDSVRRRVAGADAGLDRSSD